MKLITKKIFLIVLGLAFIQNAFAQAPNINYSGPSALTAGTAYSISPSNSGGSVPATTYGQVTVFAGNTYGTPGYTDGTGSSAKLRKPEGVTGDGSGNLYIADAGNNVIRKITPAGLVSTFAGSPTGASGYKDTVASAALFNDPVAVAIDASGNLFVGDYINNAIRKITPAGVVSTFYSQASLTPAGLSFDSSGNLIVTAQTLRQILKITPTGVMTVIAGSTYGYTNGTAASAQFENPWDAQPDASGNIIVADYLNNAVRKITTAGMVSTLAGSTVSGNTGAFLDGVGTAARFNNLAGVTVAQGGVIYVADFGNHDIRRIMPDGTVQLIAGSATQAYGYADGTGTAAQFYGPVKMYIDGSGTGYIAEYGNNRVRKIVLTGYSLKGKLPAGLSFNATTGTISGTPVGITAAVTDTITAFNTAGYSIATITFTPPPPPSISYAGSTALTTGTAFTISPTNSGGAVPATTYGQVTLFAGNSYGTPGYNNATGNSASFHAPEGVTGDGSGNLYVADAGNNAIRKVTSGGLVSTFAGSPTGASGYKDTTAAAALFNDPVAVAMDASGNLFIADYNNNAIRKITPAGVVSTFYSQANLTPAGLSFDSSGNLIVTAQTLRQILKITPAGVMTVIAGSTYGYTNGTAASAQFENPWDAQPDPSGNIIVADYLNNAVRKITTAGAVSTLAGSTVSGNAGAFLDGIGTAARFNNLAGVTVAQGGVIYVADFGNHDIRRILPDGTVQLIAGSATQAYGYADGTGTAAQFYSPVKMYIDGSGTGYIAEYGNNRIRKIVLTGYSLKGTLPAGLAFDATTGTISGTPTGTIAAVTDTITAYNATGYSTAYVTFGPAPTISYGGSQSNAFSVGNAITPMTPAVTGNPVPYTGYTTTFAGSGASGIVNGVGTSATFALPDGLTVDSKGNVYVTDIQNVNDIRKITPSVLVSTLAGSASAGFADGAGASALFRHPLGLSTDTAGNVYVADESNNAIRKITPAGMVTTIAGGTQGSADGSGTVAQFYLPTGTAVDASGNVFVADYWNNRIRKITPAGTVTTFAGSTQGYADGMGTAAQFNHPNSLVFDAAGNLYVTDKDNQRVRKIDPTGAVTTIAGNGTAGFADGPASSAMFNYLVDLAVDGVGNIYVSDYRNNRIRRISPAGMVSTLAGTGASGSNNGEGSVATFGGVYQAPTGIALDGSGSLYEADYGSNLIRKTVTTPFTISPRLPAGLIFNPQTGIISGTPTETTRTITYTITAYNMLGASSTTLNIQVTGPVSFTPSQDQNYVITQTPRIAGMVNDSTLNANRYDRTKIQTSIQYVDGLGRSAQTVQVNASPLGNDVVMPHAYDQYGREVNKYLPYVPSTGIPGSYQSNAVIGDQQSFYNAPPTGVVQIPSAQPTYSATNFEASELQRPLEQGSPGASWQLGGGHTATISYNVNTAGDAVKEWVVNSSGGASYSATYAAGTLYKTVGMDENQNNNAVIQFKNIDGQIISRWVQSGASTYLVTDYVYDDQGNLRYVIPPLPTASGSNPAVAMPTSFAETDNVFLNYFYGYHYDGLHRPTEKKIPGKGWQYVVYDQMDHPILTQDANQQAKGIWMVTKYDALGRVVMMGEYASASTRATLQTTADGITTNLYETFTNATTNYGYTHVSNPDISTGAGNKVLTAAYFDTYNVISNTAVNPGSTVFTAPSTTIDSLDKLPRSLPVATLVNVLGTTNYLFMVTQYDKYSRAVKVINQNYVGGSAAYNKYDTEDNQYSFQSLPTQSVRNHYLATTPALQLTINNWVVYDVMNRPLLLKQQCISPTNTGVVTTLSKIDYNELGQPLTKHLGSVNSAANPANNTFLQHINYLYNPRGWLTKINDPTNLTDPTYGTLDVFAEQIDYDQTTNGYTGITPNRYNGNISSVKWQTKVPYGVSLTQEQKGYVFTYDNMNRLTSGISQAATSGADQYDETLGYDELGNITSLVRKNGVSSTLNYFTYNYTSAGVRSNKLWGITDAGTEAQTTSYTYDTNGSLLTDTKKTVTNIAYNELSLPSVVTLTTNSETLTYNYDATGKKLERIIKWGATLKEDRSYDNGIEYSGTTSPSIELVHTSEGRALYSSGAYIFEYQLTDHLGNIRAMFGDKDNNGVIDNTDIVQTTDYYPFGREINYSSVVVPSPDNKYKYNGKELQADISEYDYGARFYDPVIGRWNVIDPLAEVSRRWSPYNYVYNNPIKNVDPDGMTPKGDTADEMLDLSNFTEESDNRVAVQKMVNSAIVQNAASMALAATPGGGGQQAKGKPNNKKQKPLPIYTSYNGKILRTYDGKPIIDSKYMPPIDISILAMAGEGGEFEEPIEPINEEPGLPGLQKKMASEDDELGESQMAGRYRAYKYSAGWSNASLTNAIEKFAPDAEPVTSGAKIIFKNPKTGIQVVYDTGGNYFRIQNTRLPGRRIYLDMNGEVPNNKLINGRVRGRSQAEYNEVTHFNNGD